MGLFRDREKLKIAEETLRKHRLTNDVYDGKIRMFNLERGIATAIVVAAAYVLLQLL